MKKEELILQITKSTIRFGKLAPGFEDGKDILCLILKNQLVLFLHL